MNVLMFIALSVMAVILFVKSSDNIREILNGTDPLSTAETILIILTLATFVALLILVSRTEVQ